MAATRPSAVAWAMNTSSAKAATNSLRRAASPAVTPQLSHPPQLTLHFLPTLVSWSVVYGLPGWFNPPRRRKVQAF
jgi:hypothetical protein